MKLSDTAKKKRRTIRLVIVKDDGGHHYDRKKLGAVRERKKGVRGRLTKSVVRSARGVSNPVNSCLNGSWRERYHT